MLGVKRAYFHKHGVTFVIFLIGGQNRNILKLRGQNVQFSQLFLRDSESIFFNKKSP